MSQSIVSQPGRQSAIRLPVQSRSNEFGYRPVPILAPISFLLGPALRPWDSLGLLMVPIGLVGFVVAGICILRPCTSFAASTAACGWPSAGF